ncbi:MAG: hypothetical protein LBT54_01220 [Bifidobacteriaceae bacterium]|jgi:SAM-dependent methyltransferase|nr:hypothetical protein [Bifidobacteriaceae bacterium]
MDAADLEALASPAGRLLLASLPPYDPALALTISTELRRLGTPPALVTAALTQSRLRAKARAKFGDFADGMLFTDAGVEQATRLTVAARHAARYRDAGLNAVADLTCGIGGDAMALAALGLDVVAVDRDETAAALATLNLRHFPNARVVMADALDLDLAGLGVQALWADPGRRTQAGRRVFDPAAYAPPLPRLLDLARDWPLGVKVGPGIAHSDVPAAAEAQWVSEQGTVVECGLWFGPLAPDGPGRTAAVIGRQGAARLSQTGAPALKAGPLGEWLFEPDGAVIRAGLIQEAARALDNPRLLNRTIAYVTADSPADSPFFAGFRVLDSLPFELKRLRAYLRERGVGPLTIKKRGTAVTPEALRARLSLRGSAAATIILTRLGDSQHAIVVEPLPTD